MSEIKLRSVKNIRDFSGIVNKNGKTPKKGLFIRSSLLFKLSDNDKKKLLDTYHIKTIIDLRTEEEAKEKPDPVLDGVEYFNIPVINAATAGITHEEANKNVKELPEMSQLYRLAVTTDYAKNALKEIFRTILSQYEKGAVLWHCTEGKDRCGIVSALFLSLLDIDRESVMKDYLFTNKYNLKKARKYSLMVRVTGKGKAFAGQVYRLFIADESYLSAAFDAIEEIGGIDAYLKDTLCISDEEKEKLKAYYLE